MASTLLSLIMSVSVQSGVTPCEILPEGKFNPMILEAIESLPKGGGYSVNPDSVKVLKNSIESSQQHIKVKLSQHGPYYCSGATYFAFLRTLENMKYTYPTSVLTKLKTHRDDEWLDDGQGVWGRWNANGPGTATLFHELNLGINFFDDEFMAAKPGDFLKIFWNEHIGKKERGHSVIFTGVKPEGAQGKDVEKVCYWSSNSDEKIANAKDVFQGGLSVHCTDIKKMKRLLFSRLLFPENLKQAQELPLTNDYLASLLKVESNEKELVAHTQACVISSNTLK